MVHLIIAILIYTIINLYSYQLIKQVIHRSIVSMVLTRVSLFDVISLFFTLYDTGPVSYEILFSHMSTGATDTSLYSLLKRSSFRDNTKYLTM